jgi:hypothetical protein
MMAIVKILVLTMKMRIYQIDRKLSNFPIFRLTSRHAKSTNGRKADSAWARNPESGLEAAARQDRTLSYRALLHGPFRGKAAVG